ncbi:MAG: transcription elongation factor GreA [bacterium]
MKEVKEYLSKEKFEEFKKELEFLKTTKRKEIAEDLDYARALGDLSENAEYQEAREAQAALEDRISKLEQILKSAVIVSEHHHGATVTIGSTVELLKDGDKSSKTFIIVGSEEADLASGKISNRSPLGVAVLGKKKGDEVSFVAPKGKMSYKIVELK